jgi:hypothetical protein
MRSLECLIQYNWYKRRNLYTDTHMGQMPSNNESRKQGDTSTMNTSNCQQPSEASREAGTGSSSQSFHSAHILPHTSRL